MIDFKAASDIFNGLHRELWLITARSNERTSGLIATYVACISLVPDLPRVTIALAKHHFTHELVAASGAFCLHLIDESQIDLVWRFGIPSGRDTNKLDGLATSTGESGSPILSGAIAWLDCRVETQYDTGDRTIFLAEVLAGRTERAAPPLTFQRLLELAPADKLQELKLGMERDIDVDRAAIVKWRQSARIE